MCMQQIRFLIIFSLLTLCSCRLLPPEPMIGNHARCFAQFKFNYGTQSEIAHFFNEIDKYRDDPELQKTFLQDVLQIFGKGRCNNYNIDRVTAVDENKGYNVPLGKLNDYGGFSASDWAKYITPKGREKVQYFKDFCK